MASMALLSIVLVVVSGVGFHMYVGSATIATLQRILHARALRAQQAVEQGHYRLLPLGSSTKPVVDQSIVQIVTRSGHLNYTTAAAGTHVLIPRRVLSGLVRPLYQQVTLPGVKNALLILAEPVTGHAHDVILVGTSTDQSHDSVALVDQLLWVLGGLAIMLTVAGAGVAATFVLRPVGRLHRQAVVLSTSGPDLRLEDPGTHDELASLARTLNQFLDELANSQAMRERFIASASHELRTPLAGMRAELETRAVAEAPSDEALLQRLERRVAHLVVLAEGLLAIAEGQVGTLALNRRRIDLEPVVAGALSSLASVADRSQVVVVLDAEATPTILGDAVRLEQVVQNLVINAIHHAPPNSPVTVSLAPLAGGVVLSVRDVGAGLPEGLGNAAFEPFVRGSVEHHAHPIGSGLGLSVVALIVHAHQGTVTLENHPNGGALATIWLPGESSLLGSSSDGATTPCGRSAASDDPLDRPETYRHERC
jgi:signal transduction histidine kinase